MNPFPMNEIKFCVFCILIAIGFFCAGYCWAIPKINILKEYLLRLEIDSAIKENRPWRKPEEVMKHYEDEIAEDRKKR